MSAVGTAVTPETPQGQVFGKDLATTETVRGRTADVDPLSN